MGSSGTGTGNAVELLRGQGMRMTPQRLAIVDEIMSTAGYIIPTTVIERVQAKVPGVSPSTVYRTLELLEELVRVETRPASRRPRTTRGSAARRSPTSQIACAGDRRSAE